VTNLDGVRFDLVRAGTHELLRMPRSTDADGHGREPLLRVTGSVESELACSEPYIRAIGVSGAWLREVGDMFFRANGTEPSSDAVILKIGGVQFSASELAKDGRYAKLLELKIPKALSVRRPDQQIDRKIKRVILLSLTVHLPSATLAFNWVHRRVPHGSVVNHINFAARGLPRRTGKNAMDIGGILGYDDHSDASTPSEECKKQMLIMKGDSVGDPEQTLIATHDLVVQD